MRIPAYLVVFAVALVARLIAWGMIERQISADPGREFFIAGDAEGYWDLGTDVAAGREYAVYTPPRRVLRTPGLPVAIASSISVFGESKVAARGMLAVFACLGPVMIYGLGWRVGGGRVGLIAGLLAAVSPLAVGLSPVLLSDGLFAALLSLQLSIGGPLVGCGPIDGENAPSSRRYVLLGLAAGVAVLVRPAWLPAVPAMAIALWWLQPPNESADGSQTLRRRSVGPILFVVAFCVMLAPWIIRNAKVTGHLVPTTLWLGPTLYDSFGPDADGGSNMAFFDTEANERVGMSEYEVDRWYRQRALQSIQQNPTRACQLALAKQQRFWAVWPRADEIPSAMIRLVVAGWSVILVALVVAGLTTKPTGASLLLTVGPLVYFALLHLVFVGSMRYRMPAELPLCVLAALGLAKLTGQPTTQDDATRRPDVQTAS